MEYLKGSLIECKNYDTQVSTGEGYSYPTVRWCNPFYIDGSYYIPYHPNYPTSLEIVETIPETPHI